MLAGVLCSCLLLAPPGESAAAEMLREAWASQYEWPADVVRNVTFGFKFKWDRKGPLRIADDCWGTGQLVVIGNEIGRCHFAGGSDDVRLQLRRELGWVRGRLVRKPFDETFRGGELSAPEQTADGLVRIVAGRMVYLLRDGRLVGEERRFVAGSEYRWVRVGYDLADLKGGYCVVGEHYTKPSQDGPVKVSRRLTLRSSGVRYPHRLTVSNVLPNGDGTEYEIEFGLPVLNREDPVTIDPAARDLLAAAWKRRYVLPDDLVFEAEFRRKVSPSLAHANWMATVKGRLQVCGMDRIEIDLDKRLLHGSRRKEFAKESCREHARWFFGTLRSVPFEEAFRGCGFTQEYEGSVQIYGLERTVSFAIEKDRITGYTEVGRHGELFSWDLKHKAVDKGERFLITRMTVGKCALRFEYLRRKGLYLPKSYAVLVIDDDERIGFGARGVAEYELKHHRLTPPR